MAKKGQSVGRGPASGTIKVDPDLLRKARHVAALADRKLSDYFDELIRDRIEKDHALARKQFGQESPEG